MAGTTARGLRYPTGTDPLSGIDDNVKNLADDVEALTRVGTGTLTGLTAGTVGNVTITFATPFPAGVVPVVQLTPTVTVPTALFPLSVSGVSNTGFTAYGGRSSGTANIGFNYTATRT